MNIEERTRLLDEYDALVEKYGPASQSVAFREGLSALLRSMKTLAEEQRIEDGDSVELGKTLRYTGDMLGDLVSSGMKELAGEAIFTYGRAAELLEERDELELAKLNFNFGNMLRTVKRPNGEHYRRAKERMEAALDVFLRRAPQFVPMAKTEISKLELGLKAHQLSNRVQQGQANAERLRELIEQGRLGAAVDLINQMHSGESGPAAVMKQVTELVQQIPPEVARNNPAMIGALSKAMAAASSAAAEIASDNDQFRELGTEMDPFVATLMPLLCARTDEDEATGRIKPQRASQVRRLLKKMEEVSLLPELTIQELQFKSQAMKPLMVTAQRLLTSRSVASLPTGSLVERYCSALLTMMLETASRRAEGGLTEGESSELDEIFIESARLDDVLREEAGADSLVRGRVNDELLPLTERFRASVRWRNPTVIRPRWGSPAALVDDAIFVQAVDPGLEALIATAATSVGLSVPSGSPSADRTAAWWRAFSSAKIVVVELAPDRLQTGTACYLLGMAHALGKATLTLARPGCPKVFDLKSSDLLVEDVAAPQLSACIEEALLSAMVQTVPAPRGSKALGLFDGELRRALSRHAETAIFRHSMQPIEKQAARARGEEDFGNIADALVMRSSARSLLRLLGVHEVDFVYPSLTTQTAIGQAHQLFHVMPFGRAHLEPTRHAVATVCEAHGLRYVRGDINPANDVIQAIFDDLCKSSLVLVDLSDDAPANESPHCNPNVLFELGLLHVLGPTERILLMKSSAQGFSANSLPWFLRHEQIQRYSDPTELARMLAGTLQTVIWDDASQAGEPE